MEIKRSTGIFLTVAIVAALVLSACSTKKNTFVGRSFHNITSRYNGYYYAGVIIQENAAKIEKEHRDNYNEILPLFIYADAKAVKSYFPEYDKAIKKTSLVIQRHTITDKKGKEIPGAVKWIDDNYMLLGKAHFYKRDFFSALEAFEYVSKVYKKDINRYNALLWMIRTHNEMGNLSRTEPIITLIRNDKNFPKKLEGGFGAVAAEYYIKKQNYPVAIKELTKAIALSKRKKIKARYTFILAQLYEKEGDNKKASQYFAQAIKLRPAYEMVFNARMKRAELVETKTGVKEIKKQLNKMLKDDKNKDFLDQVYYALAQIEEREGNTPKATEYLRLSIAASLANQNQKTFSYLKLAEIYFNSANYPLAQNYYDSTVALLPPEHPRFKEITSKKENLTSLVKNLNIIALEDSLQGLAKLSQKERDAIVDSLLARSERKSKAKEDARQTTNQAQTNPNLNPNNPTIDPQGGGTSWYFYSPNAISFGINEFAKKWGSRRLEDNWRRSNKETSTFSASDNMLDKEGGQVSIGAGNKGAKKTRDDIIKLIPLSASALQESNVRVTEAYYNLGSIYKEQLLNESKSIEAFEGLLVRFPDNKYKTSSYYQLYRLHLSLKQTEKSDYYKNLLLKNHPESEYTKLILNPDFAKETNASKKEVEQFYIDTYNAFLEQKYSDVIVRGKKADTLYSKNEMLPKFALLKAMAIGKTQDVKSFESALTQITIKFPKHEVKGRAEDMLEAIRKMQNPAPETTDTTSTTEKEPVDSLSVSAYKYSPETEHYLVIVLKNKKANTNNLKIKISNFNQEFFSTSPFTISTSILDEMPIIIIKGHSNAASAMDYSGGLGNNADVFKDMKSEEYAVYVISKDNYKELIKRKNTESYEEFYNANYLK